MNIIFHLSHELCALLGTSLELVESLLTSIGIIVAGVWAFYLYKRQREDSPRIEFSADIIFHTKIKDYWIIELQAIVNNKGKIQHKLYNLDFDLSSINAEDKIRFEKLYSNQLYFPRELKNGSFMKSNYFFVEPGVTSKYSHITAIPASDVAVIFHTSFRYNDSIHGHVAEVTKKIPE